MISWKRDTFTESLMWPLSYSPAGRMSMMMAPLSLAKTSSCWEITLTCATELLSDFDHNVSVQLTGEEERTLLSFNFVETNSQAAGEVGCIPLTRRLDWYTSECATTDLRKSYSSDTDDDCSSTSIVRLLPNLRSIEA